MLSVYFQIDTKLTPLREPGLVRVFNKILLEHGVYQPGDGVEQSVSALKEKEGAAGDEGDSEAAEKGGNKVAGKKD